MHIIPYFLYNYSAMIGAKRIVKMSPLQAAERKSRFAVLGIWRI